MPNSLRTVLPERGAIAPIPWWIRIVVVAGAALTLMGAGIALGNPAMLIGPNVAVSEGVRIYAGYLVSRNLVMGVLLVALLLARARRALAGLMALVALIQLADCVIDCFEGRWAVAAGVLVFGVIYGFAARQLARPV